MFKMRMASFFTAVCMTAALASSMAFAASDVVDSGIDIATTGGKSIQLRGHVEPTIISVTMPSYIPFDISKSVQGANKVVSPRIEVSNHSLVPVSVMVDYASVDLTQLGSTTWSSSGLVNSNQVAVGFMETSTQPTYLDGASWLKSGAQETALLDMQAKAGGILYVVGNIGNEVPENKTFTVTPTLVVRAN